MKPIDITKPAPSRMTTLWDEQGLRFDRDERNPDRWRYDSLYPTDEPWDDLKGLGPCCAAPPQVWTWTENIRPETDYCARTERVHCPYRENVGVCRSGKDGESLVFADKHNDIVRCSLPVAPDDRLSILATAVLDLILKTDGLDDIKSDLLQSIERHIRGQCVCLKLIKDGEGCVWGGLSRDDNARWFSPELDRRSLYKDTPGPCAPYDPWRRALAAFARGELTKDWVDVSAEIRSWLSVFDGCVVDNACSD